MRILYGRQIDSLRDEILENLEQRSGKETFKHAFLIAPAERTLSLEQRYLERLPSGSLMRAEILSFNRLVLRLAEWLALPLPPALSAQGQALLYRSVLLEQREAFPLLAPLTDRLGFLELLRAELGRLGRYGYGAVGLAEASRMIEEPATADKLDELARLAECAEQRLKQAGLRDAQQDLCWLAEKLETLNTERPFCQNEIRQLRETEFYIWGFGEHRDFSLQEFRIIQALERLSGGLTLTVVADCCPANSEAVSRGPLTWRQGREIFYRLTRCFPRATVQRCGKREIGLGVFGENVCPQSRGEQVATKQTTPLPEKLPEKFALTYLQAKTWNESLEQTLGFIQKTIQSGGWRYRDIAICCCADEVRTILPGLLDDFGIPAFIDRRHTLAESRLFREIAAFLEMTAQRWERGAVIDYLRQRCAGVKQAEVDQFENYALEMGLNHRRFGRREAYQEAPRAFFGARSRTRFEFSAEEAWAFYDAYLAPLQALTDVTPKEGTSAEWFEWLSLYASLSDLETRQNDLMQTEMEAGHGESARELALAWNAFAAFLEDLRKLLGVNHLSLKDLRDLFIHSGASSFCGSLPSLIDEVYVGAPRGCLNQNPRLLCIVGASEARFVSEPVQGSLLNELDSHLMQEGTGRPMPCPEEMAPYEDSFFEYQLLISAREGLLIAACDEAGELPRGLRLLRAATANAGYRARDDKAAGLRGIPPEAEAEAEAGSPGGKDLYSSITLDETEAEALRFFGRNRRRLLFLQQLNGRGNERLWPAYWKFLPAFASMDGDMLPLFQKGYPLAVEKDFVLAGAGSVLLPGIGGGEGNASLSVTQFERYAACPYSYLLQFVLRLQNRATAEMDRALAGSVAHRLMEELFKPLTKVGEAKLSEEDRRGLLEEVRQDASFPELLRRLTRWAANGHIHAELLAPGQLGRVIRPVIQAVSQCAPAMLDEMEAEGSWPLALEWRFDLTADESPWITEQKSQPLAINGKIDRVDAFQDQSGTPHLRVIDYKSYSPSVDYGALWKGLALQLPAYMLALRDGVPFFGEKTGNEKAQIDGARYYRLQRLAGSEQAELDACGDEINTRQIVALEPDPELLALILKQSEQKMRSLYAEMTAGSFPLKPRATRAAAACRYCPGRAVCPLENPERENEAPEKLSKKDLQSKLAEEGKGEGDARYE